MSVLVAMPAKVRGAAASEGEVRLQSLVATWVRGRGVDSGLNGSKRRMRCVNKGRQDPTAQIKNKMPSLVYSGVGCWIVQAGKTS
jgi:hypothetical protein